MKTADEFVLSEVPSKELLDELSARFETLAERENQLDQAQEILRCAHRIAFGDFTDLPKLKLLFNDAGVYGPSVGQLSLLLDP